MIKEGTKEIKLGYIEKQREENDRDERVKICAWFGCGTELSREEKFCRNYCITHSGRRRPDAWEVIKHKVNY